MTNSELNKYILHYLREDRTKSAIMLTGRWGTGKSYYIQNELIPFLEKEVGKDSCIIISLYGVGSVDEISRSLYFESRMKALTNKLSQHATGEFVAKTVIKGVIDKAGINFSLSDRDLRKLYKSINLSGKLIVLEDIERSRIDIMDILGYTYGLVEEDNAKVLLVANEDEIIKYHDSNPDTGGNTHKISDEDTNKYLRAKEKAVSDTILYRGDINNAILKIILLFDNTDLSRFSTDDQINDIVTIMDLMENHNLRSFIYACQKVTDIYNRLGSVDDETAKAIFFSIVSFSMKIKSGCFPDWVGTNTLSTTLGIQGFPLYRFCYDYIRWQEFDPNMVQAALEDHQKLKLYNQNGQIPNDTDLRTVFDYYEHSDGEVSAALKNVERRLENSEDIPIYCYGRLAYSLVVCYRVLGFDYSACRDKMISNMQQHGNAIDPEILLLSHFQFEDEDDKARFVDFAEALRGAIIISTRAPFDFSYRPEDIHSFCNNISKNKVQAINGHLFISRFDLLRLTDMFFSCSPAQLHEWRLTLLSVYRNSGSRDSLEADCVFMRELSRNLSDILSDKKGSLDKIVLLQINYLIDNLQKLIDQLS